MTRFRRTAITVLASGLVATLLLMAGPAAQAQEGTPSGASPADEKIVFVAGTTNDMRTVNPFKAIEAPEYEILSLTYDMLLNFDKASLGPAPGLAETWEQSDDGLTWTFHLREATWHDGEPVTARDIAFTYQTIIKYQFGTQLDYLPYSDVDSFSAPDDRTFVWTTSVPTIAPQIPPWIYIVPEHIWGPLSKADMKKLNFTEDQPMVGSGPFQLTEWVKGESWTLEARPDYWGGAPKIDAYVVKKFNNEDAMVTALKNGEVDYVSAIGPDLFDSLKGEEGITTWVGPATGFVQMSMNACDPTDTLSKFCEKTGSTGHPALLDTRVRTAIAWAVDRQTLVDRVIGGYGQPGSTIVPPFASQWHYEPSEDEKIGFDIAHANELLDEAGYLDTDDDGIREMPGGGDPLDFRFILRSEDEQAPDLGRFISGWLSDIGIKTRSEVLTDGKLIDAWYANDYDLYIWGWSPDPDPDFILSTFTTGQCGSWSDTCFTNAEYDQLYKDQKTSASTEERQATIARMQQIVYEEVPEVVLYYDQSLEAYRSDRWEGLEDNVSPQPDGFLWGQYTPYSALTLAPIGEGGTVATTEAGLQQWVWFAGAGGVLLVIIVVALAKRRRPDEDAA